MPHADMGLPLAGMFVELDEEKADLQQKIRSLKGSKPAITDELSDVLQRQKTADRYRALPVESAVVMATKIAEIGKLTYEHESLLSNLTGRECTQDGFEYRNAEGRMHREDGPAYIGRDGRREWWCDDKWHREDGPAVIDADGTQRWFWHDKLHREDGPACIGSDGWQQWWCNGKCHRDSGPANIWPDGAHEWFWHGIRMSEDAVRLRTDHPYDVNELVRLALSGDPTERAGALAHPNCPSGLRSFSALAAHD